jgi:hypothetical protein
VRATGREEVLRAEAAVELIRHADPLGGARQIATATARRDRPAAESGRSCRGHRPPRRGRRPWLRREARLPSSTRPSSTSTAPSSPIAHRSMSASPVSRAISLASRAQISPSIGCPLSVATKARATRTQRFIGPSSNSSTRLAARPSHRRVPALRFRVRNQQASRTRRRFLPLWTKRGRPRRRRIRTCFPWRSSVPIPPRARTCEPDSLASDPAARRCSCEPLPPTLSTRR